MLITQLPCIVYALGCGKNMQVVTLFGKVHGLSIHYVQNIQLQLLSMFQDSEKAFTNIEVNLNEIQYTKHFILFSPSGCLGVTGGEG